MAIKIKLKMEGKEALDFLGGKQAMKEKAESVSDKQKFSDGARKRLNMPRG
jgi:hypothetical protein